MPTFVTQRPYRPVPTDPPRKLWTRAECATLESSGLWDQQRLELVRGELISKMGKKRPHVNALVAVQAWLVRTFGEQFVNPEAAIDVAARRLIVHRDPRQGLYGSVTVYGEHESVSPLASPQMRLLRG